MSIFKKIIEGEIPCYKVAESDKYLAFLDIRPLSVGHTLVIPKQEVDYIFDLEDSEYLGLMAFAKQVAKAIKLCFDCKKVGITVIGLEVPHAHVHLVPINSISDMAFGIREPLNLTSDQLSSIGEKIQQAFRQ